MRLGVTVTTQESRRHDPTHMLVLETEAGLHGAIDLGLRVNVVIGDMDSVDKAVLAAVEANGTTVTQLPRDKDSTDAELALLKAVEMGATKIVLITKGGGRLDHELGVFAVLQNPNLRHCTIQALWDNSNPVPYTPLTLPTNLRVEVLGFTYIPKTKTYSTLHRLQTDNIIQSTKK